MICIVKFSAWLILLMALWLKRTACSYGFFSLMLQLCLWRINKTIYLSMYNTQKKRKKPQTFPIMGISLE